MIIKAPTNLLYANTAKIPSTSSASARTRKVRSRVPKSIRRIGVIDVSARAGLLFNVLDHVSRRQPRYTFYPVEASLPMGLGVIGEAFRKKIDPSGKRVSAEEWNSFDDNIAVQEFMPFLAETRKRIDVDVIVGLFSPMLAWTERDGGRIDDWNRNYFSLGEGNEVTISSFGLREYAQRAGRTFEAAIALLAMTQVWSNIYNVKYHEATRGCPFDFCENRDDLVGVIRRMEICPESLAAIPPDERDSVQRCLDAIRGYAR